MAMPFLWNGYFISGGEIHTIRTVSTSSEKKKASLNALPNLFSSMKRSFFFFFNQNKTKPKRETPKRETLSLLLLSQTFQSSQGTDKKTKPCAEYSCS